MDKQRLMSHLEAEIETRNVFFSIASHELRNPLTGLKLQAEIASRKLLQEGADSLCPQKMKKIFDNFNRDINRMMKLVDQMTDISKICNGKFSIQLEYIELNEYLLSSIERLKFAFPTFKNLGKFQLSTPFLVRIDPIRIEQVIWNLISNAIKYGNGSPITLTSGFDDHSIFISVHDLGPGIADKDQVRIFELFERASHEASGWGLGLYISQEISRAHGGQIILNSSPGNGATFTLKLPLA